MSAERKPLIAGNWKMNLNHFEAIALVQRLAFSLNEQDFAAVDVVVLPPFTDLRSVQTLIEGDKYEIAYGAQDVSVHASGAFTGEISAAMLAKLGCSMAVVGHSERRAMHNESNELVNAKVKACLMHGLTPIVCVGEALEIREAGDHVPYVLGQVKESLAQFSADEVGACVVAYEPVWAIGTGRVATGDDAQEVCGAIREAVSSIWSPATADRLRILYGGSVKANNIAEIMQGADIDGALVGGASLDADEFVGIVRYRVHAGKP